MEFQTIFTQIENKIGIIYLNRPEIRNAISIVMRKEIVHCLAEWKTSSEVEAVIISGKGPVFSAGFDLNEFNHPDCFDELLLTSSRYHRDVWNFPKPMIAAINGAAMGGGFDLATLCDIRIAVDSAKFAHPEIKFGAPPLFTPLRWIVGEGMARDLCLTGRIIDSKTAYQYRLISEIVNERDLMKRALEIGSSIVEAPFDTVQFTKNTFISRKREFEQYFAVEHDQAFQEILLKKAKFGLKK